MNYCSHCGQSVRLADIPGDQIQRYRCDACEVVHYQNPKMVVGCLPVYEDKILLCRRAIEPRSGYWNLPAGYLENGESAEEGAMREVWEEALTKVEITAIHSIYSIKHINQIYVFFLSKLTVPEFGVGEESLEVQLFTEADIPWKEMAFTSSIHALKCYFKDRQEGIHQTHRGVFEWKG
mgnify:CR=1 FL=1